MPIPLIPSSSSYFPDGPTWISSSNTIRRNTFCYHAACADDTACSDGNTFKYDAMSTYPNIVLYCNWRRLNAGLQFFFSEMLGSISAPHPVVHLMGIRVNNQDTGTYIYIVAYGQAISYPHPCRTHTNTVTYIYSPPDSV